MGFGSVVSLSGEVISEETIDNAAKKTISAIMSELPEEAQTYDVVLYVLRCAKKKMKGSKVLL